MHLAIDAIGAKYGGAATELLDILAAVVAEPRLTKITVFCSPRDKRLFEMPRSDKLIETPKPCIDQNYALRLLWYEWLLGQECSRIGADLLFISANFGRARQGTDYVTYVQQSLPFSAEAMRSLPSTRERIKNRIRAWQMYRSCRNASRVVCQSSVMKGCLTDTFGLDPAQVTTVYTTPRELFYEPERAAASKGTLQVNTSWRLLYVGADNPYKKLETVIRGFELLRTSYPVAELALTLPHDHDYSAIPGVRCLGYLMDAQLAAVYVSADALILPSLVESGPQPPLEAMSLGTPVMVADRPYAHDICEDAAVFFDPNSPEDFAEKAVCLLNDEKLRQKLVAKGLALVERRRAAEPYKQIVQILLDTANGRRGHK
jgi:glycosyltransferase involved in cell wall biosynthesis